VYHATLGVSIALHHCPRRPSGVLELREGVEVALYWVEGSDGLGVYFVRDRLVSMKVYDGWGNASVYSLFFGTLEVGWGELACSVCCQLACFVCCRPACFVCPQCVVAFFVFVVFLCALARTQAFVFFCG